MQDQTEFPISNRLAGKHRAEFHLMDIASPGYNSKHESVCRKSSNKNMATGGTISDQRLKRATLISNNQRQIPWAGSSRVSSEIGQNRVCGSL